MNQRMIRVLTAGCIFLALLLQCIPTFGQFGDATGLNGQIRAITTAVPFLTISPDAAAGGRGETGVAVTGDGAAASHWNLSALAFSDKKAGFTMAYTPWLRQLVPDIHLSYLSGYYNLGPKAGVISSSLRYFSLGEITFTNDVGEEVGIHNANEFAWDAGYTRRVSENFSAGVGLRFIYSSLAGNSAGLGDTKPGTSVAGDFSMLYSKDFKVKSSKGDLPITVNWGLNLTNLGAKISYTNSNDRDFIPTNLRTGIMLKGFVDSHNSISLTIDANKLMVPSAGGQTDIALMEGVFSSLWDADGGFKEEMREISLSMGLEYWYNSLIAVRTGVFLEDKYKGNRKFITLGAGVKYKVVQIDMAYLASLTQNHPLQNTIRFSLSFDLDPAQNL